MTLQQMSLCFLLLVISFINLDAMELPPERKELSNALHAAHKEIKKIQKNLAHEAPEHYKIKIEEKDVVNRYFMMHYCKASSLQ